MPARISLAMTTGELEAGPMVAMILVRLGMISPMNAVLTTDEHGVIKIRTNDVYYNR
jgi:hypothetical protein